MSIAFWFCHNSAKPTNATDDVSGENLLTVFKLVDEREAPQGGQSSGDTDGEGTLEEMPYRRPWNYFEYSH